MKLSGIKGGLGIAGTLEFRDKDGAIVKEMHISGTIPLSKLGLTEEQAASMTAEQVLDFATKGAEDGTDNSW